MKFFLSSSAAIFLLLPVVASAQAYKCKDGGSWVYQATPCANAPSQSVNTSPSSSGITGLRQDADNMAAREQKQRAEGAFDPKQCTFQYFVHGDPLGKSLAAAAKQECLSTKGQLGPAYTRWKDHFQITSGRRDAAAARSQQQMQSTQSMNCRPDGLGGMRCN